MSKIWTKDRVLKYAGFGVQAVRGISPLLMAALVMALALLPGAALAQAGQVPCRFHGTVMVDGADVPDGTPITATIDGDTYTTVTATTESDGPSSYAITIAPPLGTEYAEGTPITFYIGGRSVDQTATWASGNNIELNLTASTELPQLPCRFYGTVMVDSATVPDGTVVTAMIAGDVYTTATSTTVYGPSTYALKIQPPVGTEYAEGTPITFYIGGRPADQTATWVSAANIQLNLSVGEAPAPATPTPTTSISLTPSEATVGSGLIISGTGFAGNAPITITLGDYSFQAWSDASGAFAFAAGVPSMATGAYVVSATDGTRVAATFFIVLAAATPTPTSPIPPPSDNDTYIYLGTSVFVIGLLSLDTEASLLK